MDEERKKRKRMRDNVIGDIVYDKYLSYFLLNKILSIKVSVPITNKFMLKHRAREVVRLWHGYLTSNFHALPHAGMKFEDLVNDKIF